MLILDLERLVSENGVSGLYGATPRCLIPPNDAPN